LEDLAVVLLLPLFFAFNGLRVSVGLLNGANLWWLADHRGSDRGQMGRLHAGSAVETVYVCVRPSWYHPTLSAYKLFITSMEGLKHRRLLQWNPMIQLDDLLHTTGGVLHGTATTHTFVDWCYDSRLAAPGQIFLALHTDRRDGHAFIADAVRGGCTGVVCERPPAEPLPATVIVVPDVRKALQCWASTCLRRVDPTVIAVTGSVGKTTTKRAIATVLGGLEPTFRSRRSFNSLFGLPIALGQLEPDHRFAVLEMGVDRFGEMDRLAALFPPRIAVVTNVGPTHLRYLRDEDHIAQEKAELVRALPADGWAVLNADDPRVAAMANVTQARVLRYGIESSTLNTQPDCALNLAARNIRVTLEGTYFEVVPCSPVPSPQPLAPVQAFVPLLGRHSVYTALAAIGAALCCGMNLGQAVERLRLIERQAGRLNPFPGVNGSVILDDTYNASPTSMHAALDTLHDLPATRRVAVLGDMLELGERAPQLHEDVGQHAHAVADLLVTKGDLAALIAHEAQARPTPNPQFPTPVVTHTTADAIAAVRPSLGPGDVVLVKGSAEARMEAIVAGLLAPQVGGVPALVRQEDAFRTVRATVSDRPTWLEIDLQAIAANTHLVKQFVGPRVQVMVTLKADAYGHGAVRTARTVLQHGASSLAVATLGEAMALRDAGITAPILILGYTPPWQVRDAVRRNVQIAVFDEDVAHEASAAAEELQSEAVVHVKVDTGMARLGVQPPDVIPLLSLLRELPGVRVAGLFTHFATADSADETYARQQLAQFCAVLRAAQAEGLRPPLIHAANSAGTLRFPQAHFDLVRPGIAIYGLAPGSETPLLPGMQPALRFTTQVAQVKAWPAGQPVSYGGTWVTPRPSRIATLPVGYADGFRRNPHWQYVLVRGQRAPVVGRVAMDYTMVDVTDIADVQAGDEVVLIGAQGDDAIGADLVAEWLQTNTYEVVSTILPRVPRIV